MDSSQDDVFHPTTMNFLAARSKDWMESLGGNSPKISIDEMRELVAANFIASFDGFEDLENAFSPDAYVFDVWVAKMRQIHKDSPEYRIHVMNVETTEVAKCWIDVFLSIAAIGRPAGIRRRFLVVMKWTLENEQWLLYQMNLLRGALTFDWESVYCDPE